MGLIQGVLDLLFGGGRNVVRETVGVFRQNAEAGAKRSADMQTGAMQQFGAEFAGARQGVFDRIMDGVNRVPRPALALGTLGLFVAAMVDPVWFSARMMGIALVPEPLWWLLGVVVSFYFGARHQMKAQSFQRDMTSVLARTPLVIDQIADLQALRRPTAVGVGVAQDVLVPAQGAVNPALSHWKARRIAQEGGALPQK